MCSSESPLLVACSALSQESVPIVNMLIENGTIVSAVNDLGQTGTSNLIETFVWLVIIQFVKMYKDVSI